MQRKSMALAGVVVALVFALSCGVAGAANHGPGGNSAAAKACQKLGYLDWVRAGGSGFETSGDCTAYAAQGGTLEPKPPTWESVCTDELGGSFRALVDSFNHTIIWGCDWESITRTEWEDAGEALAPLCADGQDGVWSGDGRDFWECFTGIRA